MKLLRTLGRILMFTFLTALTQIGGLVYVLALVLANKMVQYRGAKRRVAGAILFTGIYLLCTLAIVPFAARLLGRVPLPMTTTSSLRPLTIWTCLLNRHYVRPELRAVALHIADEMNRKHPGTVVNYLDANFPFVKGFGLFPHLSHNDGRKLDLAFCYIDKRSGQATNEAPSAIGNGVAETPLPGESCMPCECDNKGYRQYSLLTHIVPQGGKEEYAFDEQRTQDMVELFAASSSIEKIFIEPHLKTRLHLTSNKIRFHGCHAVRHDDHLHVQVK